MDEVSISEHDTSLTLEKVCFQSETQYLERKGLHEQHVKPSKVANEIIGMLNAGGGVLVLGVATDGSITDMRSLNEQELNRYRTLHTNFIQPPANVTLEEVVLETGELIFLYHAPLDVERLYARSDNEEVYLRVADENRGPLPREQVRKLEYDKQIRKYEEELCTGFDMSDLDLDLIGWLKEQLQYEGTDEEFLVARHVAEVTEGGCVLKNAGVLLFAQDPEKYIPSTVVRYVRYEGAEAAVGEEYNVIKDEVFTGNIPTLIESLKKFMSIALRDYYYLDVEQGKFMKVSEYPKDAWLEGIVNALCHRSYNMQGNAVYIKHFDDRLQISNSGPLPAQVTVENIRHVRYARNPRIARVLYDMGYVRELNEGVPRIYRSMEKSMLSEPEYSVKNDIVLLLLRNKVAGHEETVSDRVMSLVEANWASYNETQRGIITTLFNLHQATLSELAEVLGITETGVRGYLNLFVGQGIIEKKTNKLRDKHAPYMFKKSYNPRKKS